MTDHYEAQAFQMRNVPGLAIADSDFIEKWVDQARNDDRHHVMQWVSDQRAKNRVKAKEVLARIDKLQDDLVAVRKKAERNEVPWTDLRKTQQGLARERMTLEKILGSLQASDASSKRMEEDPTAYLADFYGRFPALRDRRPNLAADLAADQVKRGVKAIS